jgi:hypothetical protein
MDIIFNPTTISYPVKSTVPDETTQIAFADEKMGTINSKIHVTVQVWDYRGIPLLRTDQNIIL